MQNPNSPLTTPFSVSGSDSHIQQLTHENFQLRQTIDQMTNMLAMQKELIQELRDEIAILKGQKPKPKIPPSKLEGPASKPDWRKRITPNSNQKKTILFAWWMKPSSNFNVRPLSELSAVLMRGYAQEKRALEISKLAKAVIKRIRRLGKPGQPRGKLRKKKTVLVIDESPVIQPENIPEGAIFKGFNRYTVQEIVFRAHTVQYRLARWQLPNGSYITGRLPSNVHGHYGPHLIAYILHQYHACRVTEALILDQLHACGILMSIGQLNNILIENKETFIEEVAELLPIAAEVEKQLQVDDTGGRHNGQNQYTTIINNRWFSVFTTTDSKSRINFLKLLQGGKEEYVINEDTLDYLSHAPVDAYFPGYIAHSLGKKFISLLEWEMFLTVRGIAPGPETRLLTEAALYASVMQNGIPRDLGIHSDDAKQFALFIHSLCWIHEERHYRKLIMTTNEARAELERIRDQIWALYQALKRYKECPNELAKESIKKQFDAVFQQKTSSPTLNHQLDKSYNKKEKLLRVLERPTTPLHNNDSETCARAAKIKLKISGGTRSELGRKVRDTFLSLKQTCRKLEIDFFAYLQDRVSGLYKIPLLATIIRERALVAAMGPPIPLPLHLYESTTPLELQELYG